MNAIIVYASKKLGGPRSSVFTSSITGRISSASAATSSSEISSSPMRMRSRNEIRCGLL